jgi:uncharacterized protein (UPF0548 family)
MFLTHRPTVLEIEEFLSQSRDLLLSYEPIGIVRKQPPSGFKADAASAIVGRGRHVFAHAKQALREWRQFELGWVELFPRAAPTEPGTVVAVLVRHSGLWSLNGCRVVYTTGDDSDTASSFGFAYGTLTNHAEMGEEVFEVSHDQLSDNVSYTIRAVSKPRAALARLGYPYVRLCQSRFRKDSIAAMRRAIGSH